MSTPPALVPVIDLGRPAADVAVEIDRACRDVGFFSIVNHGVDADDAEAAWQLGRAFFAQPVADRNRVAMPAVGYPYGYCAFSAERLASSLGDASPPDLKETFAIGPVDPRPPGAPPLVDPDEIAIHSPNLWPRHPHGLREAWEAYYRAMAVLADRLMGLFALGLDLPGDFFEPFIDRHGSALRMVHYPHLDTPAVPGQLRAGAHTDYGTLTILRQDDAPGGLEVRAADGAWVPVPFVDGAFVINIGDLMERWTNDRWRSTLHRVVLPPEDATGSTERFSLPFFHNANWDARVECLPSCRQPGEQPRYPAVLAGAHLMEKFRSTVAPPPTRAT